MSDFSPHPPKLNKEYTLNHCKKCGHELSPTAEFCGNCGEPVPKRKTAYNANPLILPGQSYSCHIF